MAFKSDHPVLNAQNLIFEAQKARHYGFDASLAIQSVTSIPAKLMGQSHRIGMILPGFDADLVIWNKNPFEIGAHPLQVYTDGFKTFEHPNFSASSSNDSEKQMDSKILEKPVKIIAPSSTKGSITFSNILQIIAGAESQKRNSEELYSIVVDDGIISCIGICKQKGTIVDLKGSWVTPVHFYFISGSDYQ